MTPSMLPPGLHYDVPPGVYFARELGLVRKSVLDLVHRAPAAYKAWLDGQETEPTPAMVLGTALHCAALEPERFAREYVVSAEFGDCRKTVNRDARDAWRSEHAGKTVLSAEDMRAVGGMVASLLAHPLMGRILTRGRPEVTARWLDQDTGLPCVARVDLWSEPLALALDLKTTEDARPAQFAKSIANFRYHVQAALYTEGLGAVGAPCEHFVFCAVEKRPPYLVAMYELDAGAVVRGERSARRNIRTLAECCMRDAYPGYDAGISEITLPPWAED